MHVVCRVCHGILKFLNDTCLKDMEKFATKFYKHRPYMIKYHDKGITLLIFTSFKFRLMGKGDLHVQVLEDFLRKLPWKSKFSITTSNMTIAHHLPETLINLHKLSRQHFQVEMELFPAAKLIHPRQEHVNLFHTGHIVITGVHDLTDAQTLIDTVSNHIQHAIYYK